MNDVGNTFLILLRLDLSEERTLRQSSLAEEGGSFRRLKRDGGHKLLVGLLDSEMRSTSTPMEVLDFGDQQIDTYNGVLTRLERLNARYRGENGFVRYPTRFDRDAQEDVKEAIAEIGSMIHEIFLGPELTVVRDWLEDILTCRERPEGRHVTIITNDFDIPWCWMKLLRAPSAPMLCEAVSLGTMQLGMPEMHLGREMVAQGPQPGEPFRALLINGSPDLPFASATLAAVQKALEAPIKWSPDAIQVRVDPVSSREELHRINERYRDQHEITRQFKIVHFSGHYTGDKLMINGEDVYDRFLQPFLMDSLLVLDGCSSSSGLSAWIDARGITSSLINRGKALACVVTSLPIKDDPVLGPLLWSEFYREIRKQNTSIGQALVTSRRALREHLARAGLPNPIPALYQLCGSAPATLAAESKEVTR